MRIGRINGLQGRREADAKPPILHKASEGGWGAAYGRRRGPNVEVALGEGAQHVGRDAGVVLAAPVR